MHPGDLKKEEDVLAWLSHQIESDEIEDVTDEMLDLLIARSPSLAALFCESVTFYFSEWEQTLRNRGIL